MSRCRFEACAQPVFWTTAQTRRRVLLDADELTLEQALDDPTGVHYIDPADGLAWRWTPMIALPGTVALYRAHWATCRAPRAVDPPDVAPEPVRTADTPEPELQLRMPVLPRRFTRRRPAATTHERGDHHGRHRTTTSG